MSLASIIGLGYSGYAICNGIPLLLLPSGTPEDEHLIKSEGAFHPDPAQNVGQLPAKQRRSLQVSFLTNVSSKILPLLKSLTYVWRNTDQIDIVPQVPFTYVVGSGEGFQGVAHVDDIVLSAEPEAFLKLGINITSWVWDELSSPDPLSIMGTPVLSPLNDAGYKPIAGWNGSVVTDVISAEAIVQRYSLKLVNNWNYQQFLAGYIMPPNPALIVAGNLDVSLDISWTANRQDRPRNSGSFQINIGNPADPTQILDTIYLDRMVREPRALEGGGSSNQLINWTATYFLQGGVPRSN